jgi:PAS domain S-box-containing protein
MSMNELGTSRTSFFASFPRRAATLQVSPDFIEKLPIAIFACDAHGRILWFNARAAELWGRRPKIGEGEKYWGSYKLYFQGREITREESPMATVLRTGIPVRGAEGKVERPDGSSIWTIVHIEPVEDEDGKVIGAINCFHDVTDHVHAAELLRQRDQRLGVTHEHAGIGIAEVEADGKLARVNAHLAGMLGYSCEELLGRSIFDPALTGSSNADQEQFRRQVRGEISHYSIEKQFRRRDGTKLWASITSSTVCDPEGRFLYAVRVQRDVTAQKDAEEALARRAEEQAALYEFSEALQNPGRLEDIYDCALAAIIRALRADRASILLFDDAGAMKFVAWRYLSETYRQAVEGHSPWGPGAINPEPVCIEDVEAAELPLPLKATVRAEGIGALTFIPIVAHGRFLGKFMCYFDRPHVFTKAEINLALTIARQLGLAVERMRAETARQRTERASQQLVAIVESSHDAIVSKDLNGIIMTWNQGAERLFGYRPEEVVGLPITILIPSDRQNEEPAILARIRQGEVVDHFETVRLRKDGSLVEISLTISPVRDNEGRIVGASKIARDISERKQAEAKLRESEHRLKELLAAIPAAIYTTDAVGKITYYNEKAVELAGRRPIIGADHWCVTWKLYRPDGTPLPHDQCPMAVALKEGRSIRNAEAIAERPDGTRVPFIPYPTPLRDATGRIVGAINMLVDISERKQAETQQRLLFNELNHRVKNNMQILHSLLNIACRQTQSAEAQKVLNDASNRIAAMTAAQQVLYGTIDATHFKAQDFIDAVCHTARQMFSREVKIVCEADDVELSNDAAMPLALILNELLTNAVKHGINGSGQATVHVGLMQKDRSFVLFVEDEGPGFDLQTVRQRSSGLQLVQGLARQLRGQFEVTRNPNTRCSVLFSKAMA